MSFLQYYAGSTTIAPFRNIFIVTYCNIASVTSQYLFLYLVTSTGAFPVNWSNFCSSLSYNLPILQEGHESPLCADSTFK